MYQASLQTGFGRGIDWAVLRMVINEIMRERRAITPTMALRLSRLFGNSPEFWLNAQHTWDLWNPERRYKDALSKIQPFNAA